MNQQENTARANHDLKKSRIARTARELSRLDPFRDKKRIDNLMKRLEREKAELDR